MMVRRRRPLLRATMIGGAADHAGKNVEQGRREQDDPAATPAPTPAASAPAEVVTQEEFDAQKAQLLGSNG